MSDKNELEQKILISKEQSAIRLDKFVSSLELKLTRSQIQKMIEKCLILINEKKTKSSYLLKEYDSLKILLKNENTLELKPLDLKLDIVFEDSYLMVINKPANLVVHPSHGHENDTLVNALIHYSQDFNMGVNEVRPGIVHRLDKDTSGLIVVAKNHEIQTTLTEQFKEKKVHRVYWALCHGPFYPNNKDRRHIYGENNSKEQFKITSFLGRHPNDRKRFASQPLNENEYFQKGKRAVTHFEFKGTLPNGLTLFHCILETGRTHQIRIHISEMGCPIIGDSLYGKKRIKNTYGLRELDRLGLHAAELGFIHPVTDKELLFKVEPPEPLVELYKRFHF